jgi:SAM-dependent methyltransferase
MAEAYGLAYERIAASVGPESLILDCGANDGWTHDQLVTKCDLRSDQYRGIEWDEISVKGAQGKGLDVRRGDLNLGIQGESDIYTCVYALSVLEHLLNPCRFIRECFRVLRPGGQLVILTPNISTFFTAALILLGKMPSSGPHPDSNQLIQAEQILKVSPDALVPDTETVTPVHRHLVVFSYRVLRSYLHMVGFSRVEGYGFGLYPFPNFMQPALERIDPYHCHQMVFIAKK